MIFANSFDEPFVHFLRPAPASAPPLTPPPRSSRELAAGLVPCGAGLDAAGVSPALTGASSFASALHAFTAPGGLIGTGVHFGGGYVLTARHVADAWRPPSTWRRERASTRRERFDAYAPGWSVSYVPAPGSFLGGPRAAARPEDAGRYRDWIVLHAPQLDAAPPLVFRRTATVPRGERVWLVGDHTGSSYRVTSATFDRRDSVNAWLSGCEVDTGFSGAPAIDAAGRVIGIAVAMMSGSRCMLVSTDGVLDQLVRARRYDRGLPLPPTQ